MRTLLALFGRVAALVSCLALAGCGRLERECRAVSASANGFIAERARGLFHERACDAAVPLPIFRRGRVGDRAGEGYRALAGITCDGLAIRAPTAAPPVPSA
jgi:hypothetical protein